jgi:sialate O-acetylesterase
MFGIKRKILLLLLLFIGAAAVCFPAEANVRVPAVFSDGMVLQRDKPINVWGAADPGELIGVKIADHAAVTTADKKGRWSVILKPLPLGGPYELTVHGKTEIVIKDVLMGEVWMCAGQSNMGLPYRKTDFKDADTEFANHANIRLFKLNSDESAFVPRTDPNVHWTAATKENVEKFSGVGMFFALDLYKALNIPIGMIESAHGGASLETFVSRDAIDNSNEFKSIGVNSDNAFEVYKQAQEQYKTDVQTWFANGKKPKEKPEEPMLPKMKQASCAYDNLVAPVAPYTMRGILFYQGEADVFLSALRYRRLFALMVQDWRNHFKDPTLPMVYVQLPNYGLKQRVPEDSDWAIMRETQAICRRIPYTYMVVTLDTIPGADAGMHATQKKEIAHRLAAVALATQYKLAKPYASPIYDSMEVLDKKVRIKFRNADKGLISNSLPITGFEIAGENKRWTSAEAQVDGDSVLVSSPRVPRPAAVRYGWADNPTVNLYSMDKLPVSPFRTDDWPRLTSKKSF